MKSASTVNQSTGAAQGADCTTLSAVVLVKDEIANIAKCLRALAKCGVPTLVLDSGSTDGTQREAARCEHVVVEDFKYINHLQAYRYLTAERDLGAPWVLILDADMEVSQQLWNELQLAISRGNCDAIVAPIQMYVDGAPLLRGSLCPPKPIAFRAGQDYFVATGHGEKLAPQTRVYTTLASLAHNDLKPYAAYVATQVRYGEQLYRRTRSGDCRVRDRLRAATPVMGFVSAVYSLVLRGGVFSGRAGWAYALDRILAGLIQYRVCLEQKNAAQFTVSSGDCGSSIAACASQESPH